MGACTPFSIGVRILRRNRPSCCRPKPLEVGFARNREGSEGPGLSAPRVWLGYGLRCVPLRRGLTVWVGIRVGTRVGIVRPRGSATR